MDNGEIEIQIIPPICPKWDKEGVILFSTGMIKTQWMTLAEFEERFGKRAD